LNRRDPFIKFLYIAMTPTDSNAHHPISKAEPGVFDWPLAYEAENFIRERLQSFLTRNTFGRQLADRMRDETATDFFEWVDHLTLSPDDEVTLRKLGFVPDAVEASEGVTILHHPRATLPRVLLEKAATVDRVAVKPEFLADFIAAHNLVTQIEGEPHSRYRCAVIANDNGTQLEAIERHGYRGFLPAPLVSDQFKRIAQAKELWRTRKRCFTNDSEGFTHAHQIADQSIALVGIDLSCEFFFEEERRYWENRNRAGQVQKRRQDKLGLGWGNHDHHTFRCSREHFAGLVKFLERLGLHKRERFYAGAEAGWGAQVMEQSITGIVVFADVDLQPEETAIDFSTIKLPAATRLGTVGLWVGLHGESFLDAGMHHLEARFDYLLLRDQLKQQGVNTMNPFSDFEFLRQAFTEGERWQVKRSSAERLQNAGLITSEQFEKFMREGAIGSHLENLQRHGGFKGFNQKAVSAIISATDPRKQSFAHADPH
jgi:hypothetical protein